MSENPAGTLSQRARHSNTRRTKSPSVEASHPGAHTPELGGQVTVTHVRLNGPLHYASVNTPDPHCKGFWVVRQISVCILHSLGLGGLTLFMVQENLLHSSKVFERHFLCFPNSFSLIKVMVKLWNILAILITFKFKYICKCNLAYSCDQSWISASLLQSSESHDLQKS